MENKLAYTVTLAPTQIIDAPWITIQMNSPVLGKIIKCNGQDYRIICRTKN